MVGLNFATIFLRADGRRSTDMTLEPMLRHLDHLINRLGENHVGFGSDFDGAEVPKDIHDVAGLPRLVDALRGTWLFGSTVEQTLPRELAVTTGQDAEGVVIAKVRPASREASLNARNPLLALQYQSSLISCAFVDRKNICSSLCRSLDR